MGCFSARWASIIQPGHDMTESPSPAAPQTRVGETLAATPSKALATAALSLGICATIVRLVPGGVAFIPRIEMLLYRLPEHANILVVLSASVIGVFGGLSAIVMGMVVLAGKRLGNGPAIVGIATGILAVALTVADPWPMPYRSRTRPPPHYVCFTPIGHSQSLRLIHGR